MFLTRLGELSWQIEVHYADINLYYLFTQEEKKKEKEAELEAIKQQTKFQHVRDAALKKEAEAAERRARMKVRGTS